MRWRRLLLTEPKIKLHARDLEPSDERVATAATGVGDVAIVRDERDAVAAELDAAFVLEIEVQRTQVTDVGQGVLAIGGDLK